MCTLEVQTTVFFIFKRLIVNTLQGGSECGMKSGKELCIETKDYTTEDVLSEVKNKQEFSSPGHCCELNIMRTLVTMSKIEKFARIFAITINEIPCT